MTAPEQRGPLRAHAWVVPEGEVVPPGGGSFPLGPIVVNPLLAAAVADADRRAHDQPAGGDGADGAEGALESQDPGGPGGAAADGPGDGPADGPADDEDAPTVTVPAGAAIAADVDGTVTVAEVVEPAEGAASVDPTVLADLTDPTAATAAAASEPRVVQPEGDGSGDSEREAELTWEFACRVNDRVVASRYHHDLMRPVLTPHEQSVAKELEQHAAVWVPIITFTVTAVCAVIVVFLATRMAGTVSTVGTRGWSDIFVAAVMVGFLAAGFGALMRSQAYFDALRPPGRLVRYDVADAYETVRDAAAVFVELGVPPQALTRIADLLPQAELLLDFLVDYQARGGIVKGHAAYEQLIRMGAEVTVLTDMAEERLGRRSTRRRDRDRHEPRAEHVVDENGLDRFESLADLAVMIGLDVPQPRAATDVQG